MRVAMVAGAVVAATFLSFVILRAARDPVDVVAAKRGGIDLHAPGARAALAHELGTDRSLFVQYARWLSHAATGDLGVSWVDGGSVATKLGRDVPVNLELALMAEAIALLIAVPASLAAAGRQGRATDSFVKTAALALVSLPGFATAIVLVLVFSTWLGWLDPSATRYVSLFDHPATNLRSMILPALSLGLGLGGIYTRVLRVDLGATLKEDFVTFARSKGLRQRQVLARHTLRPSSATLVTVVGLQFGALLGGSLFIEVLYGFPRGLGQELTRASITADFPVLLGVVAVSTAAFVSCNLAADAVGRVLDPRSRDE